MFNREKAPLAELQLYSDSRIKSDGTKESWDDMCDRIFFHSRTQKAEEMSL